MALELIRTAPELSSFTSLAEHQAQTPDTFYGGNPVLYYHCANAELSIDSQQLEASAAFSALRADSDATSGAANGSTNGSDTSHQSTIPGLDIYVTSA